MGKTKSADQWPIEHCPACSKPMNVCREEAGLYYCPDCLIYSSNGVIKTTDINGEYQKPLGYVKPELKLVDKDTPEPQPQNIDFYFASGDKKCFRDVIAKNNVNGLITLIKANGKEIVVNAQNVNWMEEI